MKEKKNKIIWLFFILSLILFAGALLSLIEIKAFNLNPLKVSKYNYSSLLNNNSYSSSTKEEFITRMIFLNKEDSDVYFYAGDYFQKKGDLVKAGEFYEKAINFIPLLNFEAYQKLFKNYDLQQKENEKEETILSLYEKIRNKGYLKSFSANLSRNLYLVGESYLKKEDLDKTAFWWEKTIDISPEWSYFYLDLASFYYNQGELVKAQGVLKKCILRKEPQDHCQQYLDSQMTQFNNEKPGFWQKDISRIEEVKSN